MLDGHILRNIRTSNEERHIDVLLNGARLSSRQSVLTNVEAVVACVYDVCILQYVQTRGVSNHGVDETICRSK